MRPKPRPFLRHLAFLSCVAGLAPGFPLCANEDPKEESETKSAFPSLDILPEGSILQRVKLPRYDKDFKPTTLLTADKLTVLDQNRIDGENVKIELYDKDGLVLAHTEMRHAIYNQKKSTLHANHAITLKGKSYSASGKGLIFQWLSKRGFLIGPATTEFIINSPDTPSSVMLPRPSHPSLPIAGAILTFTTCLMAEPPARLTPAELSELDQLCQSSQPAIQQSQQKTATALEEEDKLNRSANATMAPFLKNIGQGALLAQTQQTAPTPPVQPQKITIIPKNQPKDQDPKNPQPPQLLQIECDGGIYFDSDAGILAYLENIRLTEPRFKLTCSKELKVFLDQKPADPAKAKITTPTDKTTTEQETAATPDKTDAKLAEKPKEPTKDNKKKKDGSLTASFGDLKRIIAVGKVKLVRKDEKGKTYIASGETASYDAKTGTMILRGGFPRIQAAANQYLQAQEEGLYITVLKNGSWTTARGQWKMLTPTNLKEKKP